jgi:hypothetical protein
MRILSGALKTAIKSALSVIIPRYRGGNQYDLAMNRGALRVYAFDPLPEVVVCVPFGIALIDPSSWTHSWTRSRGSLERILPPEFIARLPNLNPILVRNFVLADIDAREDSGERFPGRFNEKVLGPYIRLSIAANGICTIGLVEDFGGYFHFLIEILPLILAIRRTRPVQVLVSPHFVGRYPFVQSAFEHAAIDCRIDTMPEAVDTPIGEVISCSASAHYYPNIASIRILQNTFRRESVPCEPRRIFLSRRADANTNGRVLVNESEVLARLAGLGFVPFHAEDHTFEQQLRVFSHAEIVVGVAGAGLSNTVFMRERSIVVELMPTSEFKWHFALVAKYCGLAYFLVELEVLEVVNGRPLRVKANVEQLANLIENTLGDRTYVPLFKA